ncbi:putative sulfate/molybdate transporter [Shewanella sp. NFH-SH190041]|uniref:putative sulfate/molybdate transporter n=1 Tax=Shewanella sp. NFH-SH190041 TaxID=2950245 RepID=UPI0021C30E3C|nr:putative sulfate/molybdate transporter [Shewanella sp. NFH-SH190041]
MLFNSHRFTQFHRLLGDISGAFADLGTFLPLALGLIALNQFSAPGIFLSFGLFALLTAIVYRRPVATQPMKVITALVISIGLSPGMMQASAMIMGLIMLILAFSGTIQWLARQVSQAVSVGIQLAIGLKLIWLGYGMMDNTLWLGLSALLLLFVSRWLPLKYLMVPSVLALGMIWQAYTGGAVGIDTSLAQSGFHLSWPAPSDWLHATGTLVLPQLAMTLTNAIIAASLLAKETFPEDAARFSPKRFAITSGLANLLLAPLGSAAMCHGAGGMAVQTHFGARTWRTPALFGTSCLLIALCWGHTVSQWLEMIPMAVLGSLLATAGAQLAWSKRLLDGRPYCIFVILATALVSISVNVAVGLVVGIVLEYGRKAAIQLRPAS